VHDPDEHVPMASAERAGSVMESSHITRTDEDDSTAPYVCPGCYAVGGERCAPGCIDAAMARDREYLPNEDDDYERAE
jgi:Fe-S-cluster-containing hydrogenase component 2